MIYCDRCETNDEINCKCGYFLYFNTRSNFEDIYKKCKTNIVKIFSHDLNKYIYNVTISVGINNFDYNLDINIDRLKYEKAIQDINFIQIKLEDIFNKNKSYKLCEDFNEIREKYEYDITKAKELFIELIDIINNFKDI